jgi:NADPH2:quinone reductase
MKAVICTALGDPSVLKLQDWPSRKPEEGEVRVALHAGGVNFADLLVISGRYQENWTPPFVLGTEGAGVVVECGPGVTNVREGDRVVIQNNSGRACYADETTLPSYKVTVVPDEIRLCDIAGLPINYGTSYYALVNRGAVKPGEVVVVHGASGGVGLAAVQIAKMLGATVIATGGDDGKLELVREEGADHVVNYRTHSFKDRVLELTGGRGADVYYDPVGGEVFDESLRAIAVDGRILVIGFTSGRIPAPAANRILYKAISVVGAPYGHFSKNDPDGREKMMRTLLELVRTGKLKPRIHKRFPLSEAAAALRLVEKREVVGKCLLMTERGFAEERS